MLTQSELTRLAGALPFLRDAGPDLARELSEQAFFARIPAGRDVFVEGDEAEAIALLLSGAVRVYKIGESGREITLYRFGQGGSCILTANAILSRKTFPAIATVEREAEAVMIPAEAFREWVGRYELWRSFFFDLLSERLSTIMAVVDEVAFQRLDLRIAAFLLQRGALANPIRVTHQEIAAELGSSREVISRILEDFVQAGLVRAGRGSVEILDRAGLAKRAAV